MKRVYVFVNGILTRPGDAGGWTDRAVTWVHTRTEHRAEKFEYAAGALTRRLRQQSRAEKIATMLAYYERAGFEVVLVGHSNGCDIIARVLALRGAEAWYFTRPVLAVHLLAAATDGAAIAAALHHRHVRAVHLYMGGRDRALALGSWTRRLLGWAGLGYGTLGRELTHPVTLHPAVTVNEEPEYDHSQWFTRGEFFEVTLRTITL